MAENGPPKKLVGGHGKLLRTETMFLGSTEGSIFLIEVTTCLTSTDSAIQYVTPADRHTGKDHEILDKRKSVYLSAKSRKPERWSGDIRNWEPIGHVWLNPPREEVGRECDEHEYRMTG